MWKEGIICIAMVGSILFGNVITQNYTQESIGELTNQLEELKEELQQLNEQENNNDEKAKENMKKIKQNWDSRHYKLAYYIEHDELEKVETDLTGVNSFIETNEYAEAISEVDKGIFVLKHIEEKYRFNLENIF